MPSRKIYPGVQRQWCGETGKTDNCVIISIFFTQTMTSESIQLRCGQRFVSSQSWDQDRQRCTDAGIPDEITYRPNWKMALSDPAPYGSGLRFDYVTYDEEYGKGSDFLFELDR